MAQKKKRGKYLLLCRAPGKESNSLEEVEAGLMHSAENVYTEYIDPRRDEWQTKVLPALREVALADLVRVCKGTISRRALIDLRAGRSRPRRKNMYTLLAALKVLRNSDIDQIYNPSSIHK